MAEKEYRKLAGRGRRAGEAFTWNTLWLGRDHILQVEHTGYSEEYKRFYFSDIQGFTLRKTQRSRNWTIFFLVMIALGALMGFTRSFDGTNGAYVVFTSIGAWIALFVLLLIINLVKGPSCVCYIQTAVQQEQLPSLKRIKKSHKVFAELRQLIGAAQGLLNADEARQQLMAGGRTQPGISPAATPLPETNPQAL